MRKRIQRRPPPKKSLPVDLTLRREMMIDLIQLRIAHGDKVSIQETAEALGLTMSEYIRLLHWTAVSPVAGHGRDTR